MMKSTAIGYYNKNNQFKIVRSIGNRLLNAIAITVDTTPDNTCVLYVNCETLRDVEIIIERVDTDFGYAYMIRSNCYSAECTFCEIDRAILQAVESIENDVYEVEEVETITAPEEVEEVSTIEVPEEVETQTQKNNVVSIPENIKVYGTISEYFIEGEGWISAKKATTKQVQNATQVSVNYKIYNPDGMIVNEGTEDFSIDRYHTLKKNTTHITYHVKKNNGTKTKTGLNKFDTITLWSGRINPDKRKSTLNMLHNKYKDCKFIRI